MKTVSVCSIDRISEYLVSELMDGYRLNLFKGRVLNIFESKREEVKKNCIVNSSIIFTPQQLLFD
jgi:hypothetical protein